VRPPALAVLFDRAALDTLSGDRSDEQSRNGDGGGGDGEVTHGVFLLGVVVSLAVPSWIFHIICLCGIYIHGNVIYADAPRKRSLIVNAISKKQAIYRQFNDLCHYSATCPRPDQIACSINERRSGPIKTA
jgi:hypothetical protein